MDINDLNSRIQKLSYQDRIIIFDYIQKANANSECLNLAQIISECLLYQRDNGKLPESLNSNKWHLQG